ncbi:MAG TPA: glycosyltransferase family 4 protein [Crocinitomicaceae bacterium]|jgi:glycosyltransferase involved in cell wall biosynthesis|nr:glycosyltransferase family 4 protein [Crocinitomicaceae bacterium]
MRLLILTQYYPPEIGAPQNRLHELAVRMKANGLDVEILTALPNYPTMEIHQAYKNKKNRREIIDGISVHRAGIYVSKSKSIVSRLLNYFSFVWTSYWRGRKLGNFDYLMVESPPLFLGYSAMRLAKKLNAKLIFNVSDLWPESAEKLGVVTNKHLLKQAYALEEKCYKKAVLVTGQTQGIVEDIKRRFPETNTFWLPNGVDLDFYNPTNFEKTNFRTKNNLKETDIVFFYGGILGYAQGLSLLLQAAEKITDERIKIIIQGTGPEEQKLKEMKENLALQNVLLLPPVGKSEMPFVLKEVDVALVPLKKLELFQGAIPSKIFEALAMKKALLLGVEGEAKHHFIDKANAGLAYTPEDVQDLVNKMNLMASEPDKIALFGENGRNYVAEYFNRNKIAQEFITVLNDNHFTQTSQPLSV